MYSDPQDWIETEDIASYAIRQWQASGHHPHWEAVPARQGVELLCHAFTAAVQATGEHKPAIRWIINGEQVSRRRFVECYHDCAIIRSKLPASG
jgi:hypothetical protein